MGEEFDRDPFLLFKLRGLSRAELTGQLGKAAPASSVPTREAPAAPEPLPADAAGFWKDAELPADLLGEVAIPPVAALPSRRLGGFPFWRGRERFLDALESVYQQAAQRGRDAFLGETTPREVIP